MIVRIVVAVLATFLMVDNGMASDALTKPDRFNVVLIVCDDLNDWIEPLGGHEQARTPHLEALAQSGVTFTNAHSNNPVCAPSRSSFLTGIYPHTSGNLFWGKWFENEVLANSKTLMQHFRDNGYTVVGSGKLMHHALRSEWDEFPHPADYGPIAWDGENRVGHPSVAQPFRDIGPIDGSFGSLADVPFRGDDARANAGWIYGGWSKQPRPFRYEGPDDRDPTPDEIVADWAAERLERFAAEGDGPFLLAEGNIRPHTPMYAPQEFFDLYPLETTETTERLADDAADTHFRDNFRPEQKGLRYYDAISEAYGSPEAGLKRFAQAYLASVSFADAQIGKILDALDRTGLADNTVVIVTSDHGFHVGEKEYLFKNSLWEESTRIPLIVRVPGVSEPGGRTNVPVSLIDIYPTLADLAGLEGDTRKSDAGRPLDGFSLRPLIERPAEGRWSGPPAAISMVHAREDATREFSEDERRDPAKQHWAIRTEQFRYIRYGNGQRELYDHDTDPNEWQNLARNPQYAETLDEMDALLRTMLAPIRLP